MVPRLSLGRRTVMVLVGAVLLGALILATRAPAAAPARAASTPPAVPVAVATVSRADVPVRLSALGSVTAFNTVTVRPRVDGQLMTVLFREGQFVNRGDLLAEVDPRPFQVQLEQAQGQLARDQAQLANARVDLTRYQTLLSQDSIARQPARGRSLLRPALGATPELLLIAQCASPCRGAGLLLAGDSDSAAGGRSAVIAAAQMHGKHQPSPGG